MQLVNSTTTITVIVIVAVLLISALVTSLCIWKCHCCTPMRHRIQGKCCPGQGNASSEGHDRSRLEKRDQLKESLLNSDDLYCDKDKWSVDTKIHKFEHTVSSKGVDVAVGEIASMCISVAMTAASHGAMALALSKKLENAMVSGSWKKECRDEESVHTVIHQNVFFGVQITKTVEKDVSECCGFHSNKTKISGTAKVFYMEAVNPPAKRELQEMNAKSARRILRYFDKLNAQQVQLSDGATHGGDDGRRAVNSFFLKLNALDPDSW